MADRKAGKQNYTLRKRDKYRVYPKMLPAFTNN
jgi:hypothetical protein